MKIHLLTFLTLATTSLWCTSAYAQEDAPRQVELQQKFESKMESPFIAYGNWLTDYDQARELAKQEGKFMFVYFTRSYAP